MKKLLTLAVLASFAACNSSNPPAASTDGAKITTDSTTMVKDIKSPYSILYSSKFAMDDPKNAETVLALWKAYDNGDVMSTKEMFADTVDVYLADGFTKHAARDTILANIQALRNTYSAAVDVVNAVMAVKSTDKNEHWALIWGMEKDTHKNGNTDSTYLQETWRFNDQGKANLLYQFAERAPKK
jgi:hypothetical protein